MVVNPGKNPITEEEAIILLNSFKKIFVARGKRVLEYSSIHDDKQKVIQVAMGRSGKLRAPAVHFEDTIFIGYNINIYKQLVQ
jgi:hypothetical protein